MGIPSTDEAGDFEVGRGGGVATGTETALRGERYADARRGVISPSSLILPCIRAQASMLDESCTLKSVTGKFCRRSRKRGSCAQVGKTK